MQEMEVDVSDEDYVIGRAKSALISDPLAAKAWMITARTLYPNNFGVQYEAYNIEKKAGHVKEAAKCFSDLISKFQQHSELWKEIECVTTALRAESDTNDAQNQFLCEMFRHISSEVQHKILLSTADHCEDTMEHCRMLLLLLQRFPTAISSYGSRLVDTLLSAEKHYNDGSHPLNSYRRLLVSELLPLLATEKAKMKLSVKILQKLLYKSVEFYSCCLNSPSSDSETKIDDPWRRLFGVIEYIGRQLEWDATITNFTTNWSKEAYWQKLLTFCQLRKSSFEEKQIIFCSAIFFLHCLHEYSVSLGLESGTGLQTSFVLVEAFSDSNIPQPLGEPKSKRRKTDEFLAPVVSVEKPENKNMYNVFQIAVNCWDLFHTSDAFQREFFTLSGFAKWESLFTNFLIDYTLYKGRYDETLALLQKITNPAQLLQKYVNNVGIQYLKKNYTSCFEQLLLAITHLPDSNIGQLSTTLTIGGNVRHLHYIPLTYTTILQYFVKILLRSIKENTSKHNYNELAVGHILCLTQLDWPQEEDHVPPIMSLIQQHGSFHYLLFQSYIINVDILEELTYLWTTQGGQITLDIVPNLGQRRIGTRGADKGAKEEIKQVIRKQVSRSNENLNELLIRFILDERSHILQTLI